MNKLLLIDGNSLINRAFFATPLSFTDKGGRPTNAIYGFTTMLIKAITDLSPTHLLVAFDVHAPTFRHKRYDGYKATRKPMAEELAEQLPRVKELLAAMKIKTCELAGYEADDLVGTIAKHSGAETLVLTGDNDYLQLIDKNITILLTKKGLSELDRMDEAALFDKLRLVPSQIIELKSLMGDSSDNIPGVSGIGEKTALNLLESYKTLDGVYENIDEIKGKLKEKLLDGKDTAYLSRELATICIDAPVEVPLEEMVLKYPFSAEVAEQFNLLSFKSLLAKRELFASDTAVVSEQAELGETEEITNLESFTLAIEKCKAAKRFCVDLKKGVSFCCDTKNGYSVKFSEGFFDEGVDFDTAINKVFELFADEGVEKIVYDKKKILRNYEKRGIVICGEVKDVMLMQYVASQSSAVSDAESLVALHGYNNASVALGLMAVSEQLKKEIASNNLGALYDLELRLSDVLFDMEKEGFKADRAVLKNLSAAYTYEINSLIQKIRDIAKRDVNVNSPKQLAELLYDEMGVLRMNGKNRSTDADTLEKAFNRHEIIPLILRYRQIAKLNSTYVDGLTSQIEDDGKIHTVFNQALTTTGRLSSSEPNLQNIPVRTEEGKELRRVFVASTDSRVLVSADYSQIELRLLAAFSGERQLIDAFNRGDDIHAMTAATVNDVPLTMVTPEMRRHAKAVNFGIIYGISDFGLARQINSTLSRAKQIISTYFEKYPLVKKYMDDNVALCKQKGYAETVTGRRRTIRDINSQNFNLRSFSERAAMNMPLQGSAADIIKIAMVNVYDRLKSEKLKSKLILQIHDELLVDAEKTEAERVVEILKSEMEGAMKLSVPLIVNVATGRSWYDAK